MFAVGMLGSYLTQGVYAVAGPFQPFGGAVDIIVVEQEDGAFKSSPWYVKFGDFQGNLKSQEKIVNISVNDVPADFHMFLDNKGEAYFEKEVDLDAPLVPPGIPGEDGYGSENQQGSELTLSNNEGFSNDISQEFEVEAQSVELSSTFIEERINVCDESVTTCPNNSNQDIGDANNSYVHTVTETQCVSITMDSTETCTLHSVVLDENVLTENGENSLDVSPDKSIHSDQDACDGLSSDEKIRNRLDFNYESPLEGGITSRSSSTLSFDQLQTQNEQYGSGDLDTQQGTFDDSKFSMDDNTMWWKLEKQDSPDEPDIKTCTAYNDASSGPCSVDTNDANSCRSVEEEEEEETVTCGNTVAHEIESADRTCNIKPGNGSSTSNTLKTEDVVITVSEENVEELTTDNVKSDSETKDTIGESSATEEKQSRSGRSASAATSSPSKWRLWPLSFRRSRMERETTESLTSQDSKSGGLENAITEDVLQKNGYYKWPQKSKVRTYVPSAAQLASLNLKDGPNKVTFTFSRSGGKTEVDARIYLWKWNTRIVISDVDGTITKSDVLGQVMPLVGRDWSQYGVTRLFSAIKDNGYEVLFLSARAISQAYLTRRFLLNLKQDGEALPEGPVFISPDGLIPSLYREVIRRAPHEFKISCLEGIRELFPKDVNPFYAGFGNRITDEISYLKVGIPKGKIYTINPRGEVVVNRSIDCKSYTSLHAMVDDMFPPKSSHEQEDFNSWNYWKMPLPDIEDELNSKGSKNTKKSKK